MNRTADAPAPTVLVVDDDPLVRLLTSEALGAARMQVTEADCGGTALELARQQPPDIVLLDVMMPGKGGFQTCEELRALAATAHTPVLMMTGLDDVESISRAYDAGATDFFTKPINYLRRAAARLSMETRLRQAVERDQLVLHYQPLLDLRDRRTIGAEALVRWQDPDHGLVPPDRFIGLAEETGLILPIGEWVLRTACHQLKQWHDAGLCGLKVSVNLSAVQFHSGKLTALVDAVLNESGLRPEALQFEVTESVLVENTDASTALLLALCGLGVTLAVDDFGTGYSSMSYLKHFPIDTLKIDRSFVTGLPDKHADVAIARAIVALGHSLGLKVTAEGVETEEQLEALSDLECDLVQGFLFSRPLPADHFAIWMRGAPLRAIASG